MTFFNQIIDFILPPRCIVTGDVVSGQGMLSPQAWRDLNFLGEPLCLRCGIPFDFIEKIKLGDSICAGCLKNPPIYNQARSALAYDDNSRDIILGFKHGDQTQSVPVFVPWLKRAGGDFLENADYIIPVPLHRWRILRRRFNQSGLIAQYLSKNMEIECLLDGLVRVKSTPTQGHLDSAGRLKNVKNAFAVPDKIKPLIRHKRIVLIDDVFTTGATVNECTKALLKNGAGTVDVLTLARVVKPLRV